MHLLNNLKSCPKTAPTYTPGHPGHLWTNKKKFELNPDIPVTNLAPPTLLIQAGDDQVDSINHSLVYYNALKNANVPAEMHLYAQGGHGFAVRLTNLPITLASFIGNLAENHRNDC